MKNAIQSAMPSFSSPSPQAAPKSKIGRPVCIVCIGIKFLSATPLSKIEEHVDEEGSRGADVIILSELCRGQNNASQEPLLGPTVTAMSVLAEKHRAYIVVPIDRRDGDRRLNTVVVLDRSGQVVCGYDKIYPYWSEYDVQPSVSPGSEIAIFQADFGRVGISTCFDVNFPEIWRRLADEGAELVIWPSEYSGGCSLQAHAINHHYYVVSSTETPDCLVYDITGERLLYEHGEIINVSRFELDLDRCIFHSTFNLDKRDKLLHEHSEDVTQETWMPLESWFVLKAKRPGVSARELARQYGIEELRHYMDRSRIEIDKLRGWAFGESIVSPNETIDEPKALAGTTSG
jgi:predicted amidohydrolase